MATCHFRFSAAHSWHYIGDTPTEFMSVELITQTVQRCDLYLDSSHISRRSSFKTKQLSYFLVLRPLLLLLSCSKWITIYLI